MERYTSPVSLLGEGTYGKVYLCIDQGASCAGGKGAGGEPGKWGARDPSFEPKYVAVKCFKPQDSQLREQAHSLALREARLLAACAGHENVVKLEHAFTTRSGQVYLIQEYVEGTLVDQLRAHRPKGLPHGLVFSVIRQLLCALVHMHARKVMHRDLKVQNVLLTNSGVVKLCDFGMASSLKPRGAKGMAPGDLTSYVITRWYRPPEVLLNMHYNEKVDVWSVGCLFAELLFNRPLFPGRSHIDQLALVAAGLQAILPEHVPMLREAYAAQGVNMPSIKAPAPGEQPSQLQQQASLYGRMASMLLPGMREFLAASLNPDPDQRASAAELLKLPIMTSAMMVLPAQVPGLQPASEALALLRAQKAGGSFSSQMPDAEQVVGEVGATGTRPVAPSAPVPAPITPGQPGSFGAAVDRPRRPSSNNGSVAASRGEQEGSGSASQLDSSTLRARAPQGSAAGHHHRSSVGRSKSFHQESSTSSSGAGNGGGSSSGGGAAAGFRQHMGSIVRMLAGGGGSSSSSTNSAELKPSGPQRRASLSRLGLPTAAPLEGLPEGRMAPHPPAEPLRRHTVDARTIAAVLEQDDDDEEGNGRDAEEAAQQAGRLERLRLFHTTTSVEEAAAAAAAAGAGSGAAVAAAAANLMKSAPVDAQAHAAAMQEALRVRRRSSVRWADAPPISAPSTQLSDSAGGAQNVPPWSRISAPSVGLGPRSSSATGVMRMSSSGQVEDPHGEEEDGVGGPLPGGQVGAPRPFMYQPGAPGAAGGPGLPQGYHAVAPAKALGTTASIMAAIGSASTSFGVPAGASGGASLPRSQSNAHHPHTHPHHHPVPRRSSLGPSQMGHSVLTSRLSASTTAATLPAGGHTEPSPSLSGQGHERGQGPSSGSLRVSASHLRLSQALAMEGLSPRASNSSSGMLLLHDGAHGFSGSPAVFLAGGAGAGAYNSTQPNAQQLSHQHRMMMQRAPSSDWSGEGSFGIRAWSMPQVTASPARTTHGGARDDDSGERGSDVSSSLGGFLDFAGGPGGRQSSASGGARNVLSPTLPALTSRGSMPASVLAPASVAAGAGGAAGPGGVAPGAAGSGAAGRSSHMGSLVASSAADNLRMRMLALAGVEPGQPRQSLGGLTGNSNPG